jgi:uncharacterized repeat protein (TIGR03803 family)
MKLQSDSQLVASMLLVLGCILTQPLFAQTPTTLHAFTEPALYAPGTNYEGSAPRGKLLMTNGTLYGTTAVGGSGAYGTVFKMNVDGTGFAVLHSFERLNPFDNSEGALPYAGLSLSGNTLYGEAVLGGPADRGTIFKLNTDGTGYEVLYDFTSNGDDEGPWGGLAMSGNTLYGTTGLSESSASVFSLTADGLSFKNLHHFSTQYGTNVDGARAVGGVIVAGNTLYGAAQRGGLYGNGTVFALTTDGTSFRVLHTFAATPNTDGAYPSSALTLLGNTLYGTTQFGGDFGGGTIYSLNTDGTGFTTLFSFPPPIPGDVIWPSGLAVVGNSFYGTTEHTIFKINTDGSGFATLYTFGPIFGNTQTNLNGAFPWADMTVAGNSLYGTASGGGIWGDGTIFNFSLPVTPSPLNMKTYGQSIVLAWPINGMALQSTTNLADWAPVTSQTVIVNGQNTVTNLISGPQQFYRLSH